MDVVCTAGHVDHGKSTLVRALTGMEPDRLVEERERGLTIDLGFAWGTLGDPPRTVAFVDLPGHERFVANMLAGAGSVRRALLVVAADEGWMPQSQEHLDILDLLGVDAGVVALTKSDLVDAETLELGEELVRDQLAGTSFATAPIVAVSAETGVGLDRLAAALGRLLAAAPREDDRSRPRLWIDRGFTIRGAGTVVTGTLTGGAVQVDDELAILPVARPARVRGLQALNESAERLEPGSRAAVNLSGVPLASVHRGDAVGRPDQWLAVDRFDAWVRPLAGQPVGRRGAWHLHVGSAERMAAVHPADGSRELRAEGFARLELDRPLPLAAGDRFVLREAGRRATAGGGLVLDADPPARPRGSSARAQRSAELRARLEAVTHHDPVRTLLLHVAERGAANPQQSAAATGVPAGTVDEALAAGRLVLLGSALAHPDAVARWAGKVTAALDTYHRSHPVERAAPKDLGLRAAVDAGCPRDQASVLVDVLVQRGILAVEGRGVRTTSHRVRLDAEQQAIRDRLLAALSAQPFSPPRLSAAAAEAGASAVLVRELEAAGDVVRVGNDLAVTAAALEQAAERLRTGAGGPLTAARAKELLATSRKFALPILEELDRRGVTRRRGDVRDVVG